MRRPSTPMLLSDQSFKRGRVDRPVVTASPFFFPWSAASIPLLRDGTDPKYWGHRTGHLTAGRRLWWRRT